MTPFLSALIRLAEAVDVDTSSGLLWTYAPSGLDSVASWTLRGGSGAYVFCDYPPDLEATLGPPKRRETYANVRGLSANRDEALRQCLEAVGLADTQQGGPAEASVPGSNPGSPPSSSSPGKRWYVRIIPPNGTPYRWGPYVNRADAEGTLAWLKHPERYGQPGRRMEVVEEGGAETPSSWTGEQERAVVVAWLKGLAVAARRFAPERVGWYEGVADDLEQGNVTLDRLRREGGMS